MFEFVKKDDASFNHFELDEASGSAENEDSTQDGTHIWASAISKDLMVQGL